MKKMNENQLQDLEAGKFWGWGDWNCSGVGLECSCTRRKYAFWIVVNHDWRPCWTK